MTDYPPKVEPLAWDEVSGDESVDKVWIGM
jgi:hypothetical protein